MAMSQMQVIQSLGEALAWYQREREWGVAAGELRHLCGRIGELYAALITNGQMALDTNQRGYDVVSMHGERVSVKTTTMTSGSGHISFNSNTLESVDRVIILRIDDEEMQVETLLDASLTDAKLLMRADGDKLVISLSKLNQPKEVRTAIAVCKQASYADLVISELESGTIELRRGNSLISPVKPELKRIAAELGISTLNANGNALNTRQLGTLVLKVLLTSAASR